MQRRLVVASTVAVVVAAALLTGSRAGSSAVAARGTQRIPAGLAAAIHARLGGGAIRSNSAASAVAAPELGLSVSVSADGTTALVGAPGVDNSQGAAYIFHVSSAGSWKSTGKPGAALTCGGRAHWFAASVALSADGTTAFITGYCKRKDAIFVFHVAGEDAWATSSAPIAVVTVPDGLFVDAQIALSSDGSTIVVGAYWLNGWEGGALVFHAASESAWATTSTPTAILTDAAASGVEHAAGSSVAISGDGTTVLVNGDSVNRRGAADVYYVPSEDAWTTTSTPTAVLSDSRFTFQAPAVGLSGDGKVAFLEGVGSTHSLVDVFRVPAETAWATTSAPAATLTGFGWFGVQVSSDGSTVLLSDIYANSDRGAAYVFHAADGASWVSSSKPTATLSKSGRLAAYDYLGDGLALSADGATVLVGARYAHHLTGVVDVFHVPDASSWASSSRPTASLTDSAVETCVVPKLIGLTLSKAKSRLKRSSCSLGTVSRVRAAGKSGRVIWQSRKPGSGPLNHGTPVKVRVGK